MAHGHLADTVLTVAVAHYFSTNLKANRLFRTLRAHVILQNDGQQNRAALWEGSRGHSTVAFRVKFVGSFNICLLIWVGTGLLPSPWSPRHSRLLLRNSVQVCCGGSLCMPIEQSSQGPHCPQPVMRNWHDRYVDNLQGYITWWVGWGWGGIHHVKLTSWSWKYLPLFLH